MSASQVHLLLLSSPFHQPSFSIRNSEEDRKIWVQKSIGGMGVVWERMHWKNGGEWKVLGWTLKSSIGSRKEPLEDRYPMLPCFVPFTLSFFVTPFYSPFTMMAWLPSFLSFFLTSVKPSYGYGKKFDFRKKVW